MEKTALKTQNKGFTLVELLVVIAIVAILAAVVVIIINPLELTRRSRDATRLSDLAALQSAINVAIHETTATTNVYCRSGDTLALVNGHNVCSEDSGAGSRATDGSGWVRINLQTQTSVVIPTLPIDPTNTGTLVYAYAGTDDPAPAVQGWEINANLESTQQSPREANSSDGGNNNDAYEIGSTSGFDLIN